jgi:hypothetical protein
MSPIVILLLVVIVVVILGGGFLGVGGAPFYGLGYRGGGISLVGLLLIVLLILFLTGRL